MLDLVVIQAYLKVALLVGVLTGLVLGLKTARQGETFVTKAFYVAVFVAVGIVTSVTVLFLVGGFGNGILT